MLAFGLFVRALHMKIQWNIRDFFTKVTIVETLKPYKLVLYRNKDIDIEKR